MGGLWSRRRHVFVGRRPVSDYMDPGTNGEAEE